MFNSYNYFIFDRNTNNGRYRKIDYININNNLTYTIIDDKAKLNCDDNIRINLNNAFNLINELIMKNIALYNTSIECISSKLEIDNIGIDPQLATELLTNILLTQKPSIWIEMLRECNLLEHFLPELLEGYGCEQNEFHIYDVYYHLIYSCDSAIPRIDIRMAALFHDIGKPISKKRRLKKEIEKNTFYGHEVVSAHIFRKAMNRFLFDDKLIRKVSKLIRLHMFHYTEEWTDSAVRRFIRKIGEDFIKDLFILRDADRQGSGNRPDICEQIETLKQRINGVIEKDKAFKITDLAIDGHYIMEHYNLKPGPIIGESLKYLLTKVLENIELNEEETLQKLLDDYLKNKLNQ